MSRRAAPVHVSCLALVFGLAFGGCDPVGRGGGGGAVAAPASPVRLQALPEAGPEAVLGLMAAARRTLWLQMYLLTDEAAIDTLVARRQAGCDVRVILEPHPYQADGANDAAYDRLAAAGAVVRWANPRFALTHAKLAVVDHARLAVLTLNLTRAGLGGNRELLVVDEDAADVAAAEAVVAADLAGDVASPALAAAAGRLVVSPGGTRPALDALVAAATRTLEVEMEELSDAAAVDVLAGARARGVAVAVVLPALGRSAATDAAARALAAEGVSVRFLAAPPVHAKAMLADGRRFYVGSANLTTGSLDANREVGLLLDDGQAAARLHATLAADLGHGLPPASP